MERQLFVELRAKVMELPVVGWRARGRHQEPMDAQMRLLCGTSWVVKRCRTAITSAGMVCENAGSPSFVAKPLLEAMQQAQGSPMKKPSSTSTRFAASMQVTGRTFRGTAKQRRSLEGDASGGWSLLLFQPLNAGVFWCFLYITLIKIQWSI